MTYLKPLGAGAALSALLATTALADISAQDVWQDWQEQAANLGQSIATGSQEESGNTLRLRDITMRSETAGVTSTTTLAELVFETRPDGSVAITLAPEIRLASEMPDMDDGPDSFAWLITHQNLSLIATGNPGDINYTYEADALNMVSSESFSDDDSDVDMQITFNANDLRGSYQRTARSDGRSDLTHTTSAGSYSVGIDANDSGGENNRLRLTGSTRDLQFEGTGVLPNLGSDAGANGDNIEFSTLLTEGFAIDGSYTTGSSEYAFGYRDDSSSASGTFTAQSGGLSVALSQAGLAYDGQMNDLTVTIEASDLPFGPMNFTLANYGFGFAMPLVPSDTAQDFGLKIDLNDLTLDEQLWAMFDAGNQLPRDPLRFSLDLSGKGSWDINILELDPDDAMDMDSAPGSVEQLTLNDLTLRGAGAELNADGEMQLESMTPMPRGEGRLTLQLSGGFQLLDKLAAMGVMSPMEAGMYRGMIEQMSRPGEGDDTRITDFEMTPDGSISANGIPLQ